jgi:hypothetical protein
MPQQQAKLPFVAARKPLASIDPNISLRPAKRSAANIADDAPLPLPKKLASALAAAPTTFTLIHRSKQMILQEVRSWIDALGTRHRLVGDLGGDGTELKMPLDARDRRVLTWAKLAEDASHRRFCFLGYANVLQVASKVAAEHQPQTAADCWFMIVAEKDTSGYAMRKLWNGGERNKWRMHRILHFLKNPRDDEKDPAIEIAHLCRRGRADPKRKLLRVCVNPHHTTATDSQTNLSHDRCGNGCKHLCPHEPKCIWTNADGVRMMCRDAWPMPAVCACGAGCY